MSIDNWKVINTDYLDYLRKFESRIPLTNYGSDKYKPFFGILFEEGDLYYVTQVSSPKPRHNKLKNTLDFHKLYDNTNLIAVVNLNYMFPVPKAELSDLHYGDISKYRTFKDKSEESKYITLMKLELSLIKNLNLEKDSLKLYTLKYEQPENIVAKRCFDFKSLETKANQWSEQKSKTVNISTKL